MKPTPETYSELQHAYDVFNRALFAGELPECLITLQREKNTCGYFSPEQFENRNGTKVDEIAINPSFFAVTPIIEIMQTLVHEMAHLWQYHFGKPGRGRYHNVEWAKKMEGIGLMPSSTGRPGGKKTGDSMADYAMEDGMFLTVCKSLLSEQFKLSWHDRYPPRNVVLAGMQSHSHQLSDLPIEATDNILPQYANIESYDATRQNTSNVPNTAEANKSNRHKYTCDCNTNIWGKPNLNIKCCECECLFEMVI